MRRFAYVGSSVPTERAQELLGPDWTALPPIRRGDLPKLTVGEPGVMVILDGLFYRVDAVAMAEIRDVVSSGWSVYGGVSMGALRAVECRPLGMQGLGFVYRWLELNGIEDDDELAVASCPHDQRNLSDAMVDLRWLARSCRMQGLVSRQIATIALDEVKRLPFPERRRSALVARLCRGSSPERAAKIAHFVADAESLKARDARDVLAWAKRNL